MTHHTRTTRPPLGVTLVEMMVSLAITTFVILVINQLFNQVVATVSRGTQAGEILQKSRTLDEQLTFETKLQVDDFANPAAWQSRMVGPGGRNGTGALTDPPGGFLAIIQHVVNAPLTIDDQLKDPTDPTRLTPVRSDQLMFIYDQNSALDGPGTKRMPALAPSSQFSFTGDARDSQNAEYVRMWYGHVLQVREDQDPLSVNVLSQASYEAIDLGKSFSDNPSALAQDWVLGRHALLLTDSSSNLPTLLPYGPYVNLLPLMSLANVNNGPSGSPRLGNGLCDVANYQLEALTGSAGVLNNPLIVSHLAYQGQLLPMMFAGSPLLTSAKPLGAASPTPLMQSWDVSPTHTYFMGGVSDFIVEWAGDAVTGETFASIPAGMVTPDGLLDRDPDGRIKWYTALGTNPVTVLNGSPPDVNKPVTYPAPPIGSTPNGYTPHMNPALLGGFNRASAAFVWQSWEPGNAPLNSTFTQWPWMIRIRYRLHDRRGQFEGREINVAGQLKPEKGQWYETIIPVNYQGLK